MIPAVSAADQSSPLPAPTEVAPSYFKALERISSIGEVPMPIEVELDRKSLSVRELLALSVGTVLKMNRSAGENIDIRVGGSLVGFGEIVVLEDSTGVRITDFWGEA